MMHQTITHPTDLVDCREPITDEELEKAADAILQALDSLLPSIRTYTDRALERKSRQQKRRAPIVCETDVPREVIAYLVERQLDDLLEVSGLTVLQEVTFRLYAEGLSVRQIAAAMGVRFQTAAHRLRRARRKVRAAYREGKYAGWYEVYLSEIRRGARQQRR